MATFYKYAERSAESQVNWAEIGKNMTDMLRDEVALREEKKAAIDEATRKYAEQLSNAPQGEHVGAKEEALRFADQASQYMLQQERLLKSGLLKPKDYMVARQNLVDGTTRGFQAMKEFQAQYGELMERARTDKSSILEIQALEEIQGYGNFRQSGFFIDAPTGKVNVGLKEEKDINGQKVMGLKDGSTRGMEYIDGAIYTRIDKFRVRESLTPIADSLGVEIQSTLDPATLSKLGTITSVEDLRNRKDIDPVTGQILFDYYTSLRDSVGAVISSPFQKASLLADTLGVQVTMDPNVAAKDPNLILKVIDPNTGRAEYKFSEQLEKKAEDYMTQQLLSMVTRKEEIKTGGQVELQEKRPRTEAEMGRADKIKDAENFGRNLGRALKSKDKQEVINSINYLGQKSGRQVITEGGKITIEDLDGQGSSTFDLNSDFDELASSLMSAFGTDLPEDTILKFAREEYKGNPVNTGINTRAIISTTPTSTTQVLIPTSAIEMSSTKAAASIQEALPDNFTAKDLTPGALQGNQVKITAPNGKTFTINTKLKGDAAINVKGELEKFIKLNNVAKPKENEAEAASGTAAAAGGLNATNRKPK
jgi:hypothetical protein